MYDPENYDQLKSKFKGKMRNSFFASIMERMSVNSGKQQRILDFGCGTGIFAVNYLLPWAEKMNSTILGLDISNEMIRYATEKYSHERITFKCGDIMDDSFSLGESNFDHIVSLFVLHFIKDYKEALRRLYELLKPGGHCYLAISTRNDQFHSHKLLGQDPKWSSFMTGYENFCPVWTENWNIAGEVAKESIGRAAQDIGFNILDINLTNPGITGDSLTHHVAFILTLNPFIKNIPKEMHGDLRRSLLTHICNLYGYPDNEEFHAKPYTDRTAEVLTVFLEKPLP